MNKKDIEAQIQNLELIQALARAYAEISSTRMKNIRTQVLSNRGFLGAIDEIFKEVRASYRREVMKLAKKKGGKNKLTFLAHNGKTVAVFISANTGLYGDLIQRTFGLFMDEVSRQNVEATIIGRLGLSLFLEAAPNRPYTFFDFPDYGVEKERLGDIIRHLVQYEEIHAYYGKYESIVKQVPSVFNISAETAELTSTENIPEEKVKYLFEPTLEEILAFFETQMFGSLMEATLTESQLAKYAARMLAMDAATQNVKDRLTRVRLDRLRVIHALTNRKQLNSLSATLVLGDRRDGRS